MIFVVINGPTQTNFLGYNEDQAKDYTNPNLADIAQRSIAAMLDSNLDSDIARICSLDSEFRVSIIAADQVPSDEQEKCASEDDGGFFPQPFMACLYDMGFRQGQIYRGSQSPNGFSCQSGKDMNQP